MAKAKARAMARAAANAAAQELEEESPSKVGYEIGDFFGIAFVYGIADNIKKAFKASTEMATSAKDGLSRAISKVSDLINTDMDMQPTIRPVLDLSDISNGAGAISGMFNMRPSVGVMANIGSISNMMNRNQNGTNNDVISAIKDLGRKISDSSGDTYQINGITYDDGSNVTNAIKTIVREARMERRR